MINSTIHCLVFLCASVSHFSQRCKRFQKLWIATECSCGGAARQKQNLDCEPAAADLCWTSFNLFRIVVLCYPAVFTARNPILPDAVVNLSQMYQHKPLKPGRNIRVLLLHPATKLDAPINCSLKEMSLDDVAARKEHYSALSYVRNGSGQGHSTVKFPVRKGDGRSARLLIYTDTPIQINS
jgi:hypothetical protein